MTAGADGPEAAVYNSFPLNDCPAELWDKLDAEAIAKEHGAVAALLNGPRHWLMSTIDKVAPERQEIETFGGIDMIKQATVKLSSMNPPAPYTVNHVDRRTVFNFDAGRPVFFELVDPQGQRWVMQTYSKAVDRDLDLTGLPGWPPGWICPRDGVTRRALSPND